MKFKLSKDKTDGLNDFQTLDELNEKIKKQEIIPDRHETIIFNGAEGWGKI